MNNKLIKQNHRTSYIVNNQSLSSNRYLQYLFDELSIISGSSELLLTTQDEESDYIGTFLTITRELNKISIFLTDDLYNEDRYSLNMPVRSAKKLFIQMERAYFEQPDEIYFYWHHDNSASLHWIPTSIRQTTFIKNNLQEYSALKITNPHDTIMKNFLNMLLTLFSLRSKNELRWFWTPREGTFKLGHLEFSNKFLDDRRKGSFFIKDKHINNVSLALSYNMLHRIYSQALRIYKEQPSTLVLKWYEHGVAFE